MTLPKKDFKELTEMLKRIKNSERFVVFMFDSEVGETQFLSSGLCFHQVNDLLIDALNAAEKNVPVDEKKHNHRMGMN